MAWLGWFTGVGLLLAALAASHVTVTMELTRARNRDCLSAEVRALFGWVRYRFRISDNCYEKLLQKWIRQTQLQGEAKKRRELMQRKRQLLLHTDGIFIWLRRTLHHVKCSKFRWVTRFGLTDAAGTGTAAGVVLTLQSTLAGLMLQDVILEAKPELAVEPLYQEAGFAMEFAVSARIRLWFLLSSGAALAMRIYRSHGGFRVWRSLLSKRGKPLLE